jgi:hypothetical protein
MSQGDQLDTGFILQESFKTKKVILVFLLVFEILIRDLSLFQDTQSLLQDTYHLTTTIMAINLPIIVPQI